MNCWQASTANVRVQVGCIPMKAGLVFRSAQLEDNAVMIPGPSKGTPASVPT